MDSLPPPFLLSRSSAFFFFDLLDFFSLTLFEVEVEVEEAEDEPAGEETEECFTLRVRLVAEAEETEDALEVVDAGDPGREVEAARLGGRAVAAAEVTGGASATSILDSEESSSGNFRA